MSSTIFDLAHALEEQGLLLRSVNVSENLEICGADCDSRVVLAGHIFICKGQAFKPSYLTSALEKGAVAWICGENLEEELADLHPGLPYVVVSDVYEAMSVVSPLAWSNPTTDGRLRVAGVTGTKGKSTVACMLRAILDAGHEGPQTGLMGSITTFDGKSEFVSINTTPEAADLWRHLNNCVDSGLKYMTMEVSSQALKYGRVRGLGLEVACFLNIGKDHISPVEHSDFEDYFSSKLKIFNQAELAVVNLDADHVDRVLRASANCKHRIVFTCDEDVKDGYFGYNGEVKNELIWADRIEATELGMRFLAITPKWSETLEIGLIGRFNVENALAAVSMAYALGIGPAQIKAGLAEAKVEGRMELLRLNKGPIAIVDYAHNQLSYERFFPAVKEHFAGKKLIAVFGCPGGKAQARRKELPEVAAKWADFSIYTEDDPGLEAVTDILDEMAANTPAGANFECIESRERAIERAVELGLELGDAVVCMLGKGDELYMHRGNNYESSPSDLQMFEAAVEKLA